ncbi:hypothetical protein FAT80_16385 [Klebsiella pneumoniae]|nr:hypothetical protein FAT80_16385 [Klebsiella pneumoniae]
MRVWRWPVRSCRRARSKPDPRPGGGSPGPPSGGGRFLRQTPPPQAPGGGYPPPRGGWVKWAAGARGGKK